jgi:hypothetical protein
MTTSRLSGDAFEYIFVNTLKTNFSLKSLNPYTDSKEKNLYAKYLHYAHDHGDKVHKLVEFLTTFLFHNKMTIYELTNENANKHDTTDVRLYNDTKESINISLKHNNKSIKHPRPRNLFRQVASLYDTPGYIKSYARINDIFYTEWKHVRLFKDVPQSNRTELFERVNALMVFHLSACTAEDILSYIYFLTAYCYDVHHIIWYKNEYQTLNLNECVSTMKSVVVKIYQKHNFVYIGDHIKMRLHTASSRISRTLSLKYDVQMM